MGAVGQEFEEMEPYSYLDLLDSLDAVHDADGDWEFGVKILIKDGVVVKAAAIYS